MATEPVIALTAVLDDLRKDPDWMLWCSYNLMVNYACSPLGNLLERPTLSPPRRWDGSWGRTSTLRLPYQGW